MLPSATCLHEAKKQQRIFHKQITNDEIYWHKICMQLLVVKAQVMYDARYQ